MLLCMEELHRNFDGPTRCWCGWKVRTGTGHIVGRSGHPCIRREDLDMYLDMCPSLFVPLRMQPQAGIVGVQYVDCRVEGIDK